MAGSLELVEEEVGVRDNGKVRECSLWWLVRWLSSSGREEPWCGV